MSTYTNIAAHAGVSIAAVSRAYTPGASISAKMLAKISLAAKQLGHPLPPLPLIGLGLPPLEIGVVSGKFPLEWQDTLLQGINRGANHWNVKLHVSPARQVVEQPEKTLEKMDGILVLNGAPPIYDALAKVGKPWVDSLCVLDQQSQSSVITMNYAKLGQQLAHILLSNAYQRITCVLAGADTPMQRAMFRGLASLLDHSANVAWQQVRLPNAEAETLKTWSESQSLNDARHAYCCFDGRLASTLRQHLEVGGKTMPKDGGLLSVSYVQTGLEDLSRLVIPLDDLMSSSIELLRGLMVDPTRQPELRLLLPQMITGATIRADHGAHSS